MIVYMGKPHLKGVPFSGFRCIKGQGNPSFSYFEGPLIKILQQMHFMAVSDYLFLSDFFKCKANFEPHK